MAASGNVRYSQIRSGDRSGNGTKLGTVTGSLTTAKQLQFDADGNIEASASAVGSTDFGNSGTVWEYVEAPPTTSWSWVNQNSATVTTVRSALTFRAQQINGTGSTLYVRTAPSAPWTLTVRLVLNIRDVNFWNHGIIARESATGKFVSCGFAVTPAFRYARWSDPNTISANTDIGFSTAALLNTIYIRLVDDNTNLSAYYGDGYNFYLIDQQARTSHMAGGADQIGILLNKNNSTATYDYVTLRSWRTE